VVCGVAVLARETGMFPNICMYINNVYSAPGIE
jgi:hypothetical protein